jgi:3-dehydroquinate synthase
VVGQDERETGLRAILNFGHTIGHAIENISGYGTYLHGEAISIGQVAAARLSAELAGLPVEEADRIEKLFVRAGLPVSIGLTVPARKRLLEAMKLDKKVSGGQVKFVLARSIGRVEPGHQVPAPLIEKVLAAGAARRRQG